MGDKAIKTPGERARRAQVLKSTRKWVQGGRKKWPQWDLPPHPPVTQAGGTRTIPTPSGGGVRNGRDTINPYP